MWPHVQRFALLAGWKSPIVSYLLMVFGGHWSCSIREITYLICHVTSFDHVVKVWLYGWNSLTLCNHRSTFGGHRHCGSGEVIFLVWHMILQDHVIKGFCDFMTGNPPQWITTSACLMAIISIVVVEIKCF